MQEWTLESFNAAPVDERLHNALQDCCAAESWIDTVAAGRPYDGEESLYRTSDEATAALDGTGLDEALAGHPRIGERAAGHGPWSEEEQAGASEADADTRQQLATANAEYEKRFGNVYLVFATGKTAAELLELCRSRLTNEPAREHDVVLGELAKINRLRLHKMLHGTTT
jgi:2-oxo-4-hydroxy-4-carboxy-5-ureidoimidazoline decarboxylase